MTGHDSPADLGLWGRIRSAFRRLHVHLHRNPITALATKVVITVLGVLVIGAGLVMMVTPGPGIVGIIVGLGILATEWHWAERWMHAMKERAQAAADVARDMDPAVRRRRLLLTALGLVVIVGSVIAYVSTYGWPGFVVEGWDWVQGFSSTVPDLPGT